MQHPPNYKTQSGLLKALSKASEIPMSVSLAWWFKNAEYTLVNKWGWTPEEAARFVAAYHPTVSAYTATA